MQRHLHLGFHFKPTDQELMVYLHCRVNNLPSPRRFVLEGNLKYFRIDQPPDIRRDGCLGRLYWYMDCSYKQGPGQITRDRRTNDRKGNWKATDHGQEPVYDEEGKAVGHKQKFRFHQLEPGKKGSTTWVMAEYTIYSNKSKGFPESMFERAFLPSDHPDIRVLMKYTADMMVKSPVRICKQAFQSPALRAT